MLVNVIKKPETNNAQDLVPIGIFGSRFSSLLRAIVTCGLSENCRLRATGSAALELLIVLTDHVIVADRRRMQNY